MEANAPANSTYRVAAANAFGEQFRSTGRPFAAVSLRIEPAGQTLTVAPGAPVPLKAYAVMEAGLDQPVTYMAGWASSNPQIPMGSPLGTLLCDNPGSTNVTATFETLNRQETYTVAFQNPSRPSGVRRASR